MVDNQKNNNTRVTDSKIGVLGNHVTAHGGIHFYQSIKSKDAAADSEKDESMQKQSAFDPANAVNILPIPEFISEIEIKNYCKKAESLHSSLPVAGFAEDFKVPINIDDIYIPLRAMVNLRGIDDIFCYGDSNEAEKHLARCDAAIEISLVDSFEQAEKRGRNGLVILGDPGSGKTSNMKRMLLWCLRKGPETMGLSKDMLPVFLPLREIKHLAEGLDRFIQNQLTSRHLKMRMDFGKRLMDRGNLLFVLDGLDEVADLVVD